MCNLEFSGSESLESSDQYGTKIFKFRGIFLVSFVATKVKVFNLSNEEYETFTLIININAQHNVRIIIAITKRNFHKFNIYRTNVSSCT
jgi:hypothetical protein